MKSGSSWRRNGLAALLEVFGWRQQLNLSKTARISWMWLLFVVWFNAGCFLSLIPDQPGSRRSSTPARRAQVLKDEYSHIRRQQGHSSVCRMELLMVLLSKIGEFYPDILWLSLATLLVSLVALPTNGLIVTGMIFQTVFLISAHRVPVIFGASEGSDGDQQQKVFQVWLKRLGQQRRLFSVH